MTTAEPHRPRHLPALDGVRAIALVTVLFHHFLGALYGLQGSRDRSWFASPTYRVLESLSEQGVYGVDLFFALSGFLITGILIDTRDRSTYFRTFYARRTLRIFPLYYFYLFLVLVVLRKAWAWRHGVDLWAGVPSGWYVAYLSNWLPDRGTNDPTLGHMWSLAVEEQFYMIWPLIVAAAGRRLGATCLAMAAAAFAVRAGMLRAGFDPDVIYRTTPARMDGLALGAFMAAAYRDPRLGAAVRRLTRPLAGACVLGVAAIVTASGGFDRSNSLVLLAGWTLTAIASSLLVFHAADSGGRLARFLGARPVTFIGQYSYAMYVFHILIQWAFVRSAGQKVFPISAPRPVVAAAMAAVATALFLATLATAMASKVLLEGPFNRLKSRFPYGPPRRQGPTGNRHAAPGRDTSTSREAPAQ